MFQKAIAFCLYGKSLKYSEGMIRNAIIAPHVFQGWDVVVYYDRTVDSKVLETLKMYHCHLIDCTGRRESGMFWRFLINDVAERWISRDADSRLDVRDLCAVNEWIASGKKWHVIRDHIDHHQRVLGGLWGGFHTGVNMQAKISEWDVFGKYDDDQEFIKLRLWDDIKKDVLIHDIKDNPIKHDRVGRNFLGQIWDERELS